MLFLFLGLMFITQWGVYAHVSKQELQDEGAWSVISGLSLLVTATFLQLFIIGMGSKKQPVHVLVAHGSMHFRNPPPVDYQQLCSWFQDSPEGGVEGIVWHCNNGTLVKVCKMLNNNLWYGNTWDVNFCPWSNILTFLSTGSCLCVLLMACLFSCPIASSSPPGAEVARWWNLS